MSVLPARPHPHARAAPASLWLLSGFEDQTVAISPEEGIVIVRLGATKIVGVSWDKAAFYSSLYACRV